MKKSIKLQGGFGEQVTNTNGLKVRDGATCNNKKIRNLSHKSKNKRTYTWSARNSRRVTDHFVAKRRLPELFLDVRVYRGSDSGSVHFLTSG